MATIAAARRLLSVPFRVGGRTTSQLIHHQQQQLRQQQQQQQQQSKWCRVFPSLPWSYRASTYCTVTTSDPPADPGKPEETKHGNAYLAEVHRSVVAGDFDGAYSLMQRSGSTPMENKLKNLINHSYFQKEKRKLRTDEEKNHILNFLNFVIYLNDQGVKVTVNKHRFHLLRVAGRVGHVDAANMLFAQLEEMGKVSAGQYFYLFQSYINRSARTGLYEDWSRVEELFTKMVEMESFEIHDANVQSFIDYSAKCGKVEVARKLVDENEVGEDKDSDCNTEE